MPALKTTRPVIGGLLALLAMLVAGALLINAYVQKERQRDLDHWAIRLGLIAETRVNSVEGWLDEQTQALGELANNASLQLYLWKLSKREEQNPTVEPAQLSYLRNLVLASAERYGFLPDAQQPVRVGEVLTPTAIFEDPAPPQIAMGYLPENAGGVITP